MKTLSYYGRKKSEKMKTLKNTKIICTLGPVSDSAEAIYELAQAGMNVARLNFSHGDHEEQLTRMETIKRVNREHNTNVSILLDTKGPEIRTHKFANGKATIVKGSRVFVHMNEVLGDDQNFSITFPELIDDVKIGGKILVNDGALQLLIRDIDKEQGFIETVALNTSEVKDRRGINVPDVILSMPYFSQKDQDDIAFGCKNDIDFIAASFVRRKDDILEIKEFLKKHNSTSTLVIAKIENREGVQNLEEIVAASDGVMVARGDLGVEVPIQDVPLIQTEIIKLCHAQNKIVIVATQMLESMISNPRPTRAEVSDVANAVLEGADAIMLSGETAMGKYPIETVKMMTDIALRTESAIDHEKMAARVMEHKEMDITSSIALSASDMISKLNVSAVIAPTVSGFTARKISQFRPKAPIIALTPNRKVAKTLNLNWGVHPFFLDFIDDPDTIIDKAVEKTVEVLELVKKDMVIITAGMPLKQMGTTNMIRILEI